METNHRHFMNMALDEARQALSMGEFPVGCVMAYEGRVVAVGARKNSSGEHPNELDHAEMVALRKLSGLKRMDNFSQVFVYSTMEPCLMCYSAMIISGIRHIVWAYEDIMGGGTQCNLKMLPPLYSHSRISIVPYFCRQESLEIFKNFFSNPDHGYWKGSLLAEYTLNQ